MNELIKELEKQIRYSVLIGDANDVKDYSSGTEDHEGVYLTRKEAEMILNILKIYQQANS